MRLWHASGPVSDDILATILSSDLCWKTLVIEEISKESSWSDLFRSKSFESVKAFFEKMWDGTNHPAAKTASAIVLSIAGVGVAKKLAPEILTIPVRPVLSKDAAGDVALPLTLKTDGVSQPLKVQFQPPDSGATIPVDLRFKAEGKPIDDPSKMIQDIAVQLAATNKSISNASLDLHAFSNRPIVVDTRELNNSITGVSSHITDASNHLNDLNDKMKSLQDNLDSSAKEQQDKADLQSQALNKSLQVVSRASQRNIISLVLHRGVPQSAVLPYLDGDSGEISTRTVEFAVSAIGKDKNGEFVKLTWLPENGKPQNGTLYEGESLPLTDQPKYRVSLNATSKKWFVNKIVEITLAPQAEQLVTSRSQNDALPILAPQATNSPSEPQTSGRDRH
jgi:hypothetical protein